MRILLVEDDRKIADFIVKGMREAGFMLDHFDDGINGLHAAISGDFDLAILDLVLPSLDGFSIIKRIRNHKISMPIIILSAKRTVDDRVNGLRQGGDDYLVKPFSFCELLARVEALIRRSYHHTEPASISYQDLSLDLLSRTATRSGKKISLQPKEFSLLEYLVRNAGKIVSKTMIMERVWDYNFDPGTNVVEARISRLREKVDHHFDKPLIHTVRGFGYILKEADD